MAPTPTPATATTTIAMWLPATGYGLPRTQQVALGRLRVHVSSVVCQTFGTCTAAA